MPVLLWALVAAAALLSPRSVFASASMLDTARECLQRLPRSTTTQQPRSLGIRISDDRTEAICRIAMEIDSSGSSILYEVTLSSQDLHLIALRQRKAGTLVALSPPTSEPVRAAAGKPSSRGRPASRSSGSPGDG
jgi:hypothetical protein